MVARIVVRLDSIVSRPLGPALLALALALVSLPFVALTLHAYPYSRYQVGFVSDLSPTDPARWTAAVSAVIPSALVTGVVARLVRRHRNLMAATFLLAWIVAIATTPVIPTLLGQNVGFGGPICIDTCWAPISTSAPAGAPVIAVLFWWLGPLVGEFGPFAVLAAGFVAWFRFVYRISPPQVATPWAWTPSQWPPPRTR
jgi:hypothetical protein